jgi:hypothetical protein
MPRLKKKNMQAAPVVPVACADNFGVTMTFKHAAQHYGVPVSTIRTVVKNYGLDVAQMGKYKTVRLVDLEVLWAKLAICEKLNADPLLRKLRQAKRWRWEPERKGWGPTMPVMDPWMALKRADELGLVRWREEEPGKPPEEILFGPGVHAQAQIGAFWFRLLDKGWERRSVAFKSLGNP